HNVLDLAQHAQTQWRPRIQAGSKLADHSGLQHQLVADDFGFGRDLLAGMKVELRQTHGRGSCRGIGHSATEPSPVAAADFAQVSPDEAVGVQWTLIAASASCCCALRCSASIALSGLPSPS